MKEKKIFLKKLRFPDIHLLKNALVLLLLPGILFIPVEGIRASSESIPFMEDPPSITLRASVRIAYCDDDNDDEETVGPAEFQVVRPAAVIKVTYSRLNNGIEVINHLQRNMLVRWQNNAERSSDVEFKTENLIKIGENPSAAGGPTANSAGILGNSTAEIPARYVLMRKSNETEYVSLEKYRTVLDVGEDDSELHFKIDETFLRNNVLQSGIYRGDIVSNPATQGRSPHIIVQVENNLSNNNPGNSGSRGRPAGPLEEMNMADLVGDIHFYEFSVEELQINRPGNSNRPEDIGLMEIKQITVFAPLK